VLVAGLGWGAAAARAQADDRPWVFLSGRPDEPADKDPAAPIRNILLRPNVQEPLYLYVRNPTDGNRQLTVSVESGDGAGDGIGRAAVAAAARQTVRVALPTVAAPAAPAAPGATTAPATAAPAARTLRGRVLQLRLLGEKGEVLQKTVLPILVQAPNQYVRASAAFEGEIGSPRNRLLVRVEDRRADGRPFTGPSADVQLELNVPGLIPESTKAGTYQAKLPPGGAVTLTAENLRFREAGRRGVVAVTVDGYKRAFLFETDFGGTNPQPLTATALSLGNPRYAIPGKPCPVPLAVDNAPRPDDALEFGFDRAGTGTFETTRLDGERRQRVTVAPGGPDDGLVFATEVGDWVVDLNTAGVFGTRALRLRLLDPQGTEVAVRRGEITLDDTPPEGLRLGLPSKPPVRGLPLKVTATGADPESGVREVLFFVGDPPTADGKPAPGGRVAIAPPAAAGAPYAAELPMPNQTGPVKVGVRFTNAVGLSADKTAEVELVDPSAAGGGGTKPTVGKIKGKVVQGSEERPQPGLRVQLRDEKGTAVVKTTDTNAKGEFTFEDVAPGNYNVYSVKPTDANAKALKPVTVKAGETTNVTLALKR
jgi:hypothetical protein